MMWNKIDTYDNLLKINAGVLITPNPTDPYIEYKIETITGKNIRASSTKGVSKVLIMPISELLIDKWYLKTETPE